MDITTWLALVAASTLLLLLPGPTVLLVLSYALTQGRRVALATVAGVMASTELFTVLKWAGEA